MNKEEAIRIFRKEIECLSHAKCEDCILEKVCDPAKTTPLDSEYIEAYGMAIQALSQVAICPSAGVNCEDCPAYEPCEDASRDFHIGDEVRIIGSDPIYDDCDVGWVIRNASEKVKTMYVMRNDGSAGEEAKAEWYKTGRHNAMLAEVIKALPSFTHKSGKWIKVKSGDKDFPESIVCSRCNNENSHLDFNENAEPIGKVFVTSKYCPNCGAKMESEK